MEIAHSARRHGVVYADILAAITVPLRTVRQDQDRVLIIGADAVGAKLEVVVLDPDDEPVAIHAMPLRSKFSRYL